MNGLTLLGLTKLPHGLHGFFYIVAQGKRLCTCNVMGIFSTNIMLNRLSSIFLVTILDRSIPSRTGYWFTI